MALEPGTATPLPARDHVSGMIGRPVTIASARAPPGAATAGAPGAAGTAPGARGVVSAGRGPTQAVSRARTVRRLWRMLNCSALTRVRVNVQLGATRRHHDRPGLTGPAAHRAADPPYRA